MYIERDDKYEGGGGTNTKPGWIGGPVKNTNFGAYETCTELSSLFVYREIVRYSRCI